MARAVRNKVGDATYGDIPVAQYLRMSTEHQRYSPENQSAAISSYAAGHGMRIVKTYSDLGRSGLTLSGRQALQELLRDVQEGEPQFEAVLVLDVSRWGRFQDPDESAEYERTCRRNGVRVVYCAEEIGNDGSISDYVLVSLKRWQAAEYSRELSAKVHSGQRTIALRGYRVSGPPGLGFRRQLIDENERPRLVMAPGERKSIQTDRVRLVPGPKKEIATIHKIYELYLEQGLSMKAIAAHLNKRGIMTDRGRPWARGSVRSILTNEKYIGNNVFDRCSTKLKSSRRNNPPECWVRVPEAFPALISTAKFNRVKDVLSDRNDVWSKDELLDLLRPVLEKHGKLTTALIESEKDLPGTSTFRRHFGSLLKAYALVGYSPTRNYSFYGVQAALSGHQETLVHKIVEGVHREGGVAIENESNLLTVNDEFTLSVSVANSFAYRDGHPRWRIDLSALRKSDVAVVARLDAANKTYLDFFIVPGNAFAPCKFIYHKGGRYPLDIFRSESLDGLCSLCRRVPLHSPSMKGSDVFPIVSNQMAGSMPPREGRQLWRSEMAQMYQRALDRYTLIYEMTHRTYGDLSSVRQVICELLTSVEFRGVLTSAKHLTLPLAATDQFPFALPGRKQFPVIPDRHGNERDAAGDLPLIHRELPSVRAETTLLRELYGPGNLGLASVVAYLRRLLKDFEVLKWLALNKPTLLRQLHLAINGASQGLINSP